MKRMKNLLHATWRSRLKKFGRTFALCGTMLCAAEIRAQPTPVKIPEADPMGQNPVAPQAKLIPKKAVIGGVE